jgi:hypothetical protein
MLQLKNHYEKELEKIKKRHENQLIQLEKDSLNKKGFKTTRKKLKLLHINMKSFFYRERKGSFKSK